MRPYFIGTRGSALALAQTSWVQQRLQSHFPQYSFELKIIKTLGDHLQKSLSDSSPTPLDKGLFTKELEAALLTKEIDFAVHSLKDLPTAISPELCIAAIPQRANPQDVLITRQQMSFQDLPPAACLGTGSLRRQKELLRLRPDLRFIAIRGNIDTRLDKLRNHLDWDGLILAAAGIERLSPVLNKIFVTPLDLEIILPAPGQGALAIQTRTSDSQTKELATALEHPETRYCVETERQFLAGLGGGCQFPLGAYAHLKNNQIELKIRFYTNRLTGQNLEFSFPLAESYRRSFEAAQEINL